jgi:hypothetical protein
MTTKVTRMTKIMTRLWKIWQVFDMLNVPYSKFYSSSEHLAIDKVIVLFKGKAAFKQCIPTKHKRFGIEIYRLCDRTGYTYDTEVY